MSPEGVGDGAGQSSCLRVDDLQDVLSQHVLASKFHNWDVVVAWAFEDCQPDCLECSEVRGGITSINGMVSAAVASLEGGRNWKLRVGGADNLCHFEPI